MATCKHDLNSTELHLPNAVQNRKETRLKGVLKHGRLCVRSWVDVIVVAVETGVVMAVFDPGARLLSLQFASQRMKKNL